MDKRRSKIPLLATSDDPAAAVTGQYFFHERLRKPSGVVHDQSRQDRLLAECMRISGIELPSD